ncbi:pentatricopeptide repeat-containing protein [Tripterygium wilfordii]|uniref:Pentatricopeptide repeat-containing protein n=2 Tax=Tripterygium wilfordii TaxID=458696 RepID=A0A7J7CSB5_TRIWF|nr:pentatricopeptide repeat-containing protein [Tripterygium wilfordii]
MAATTHLPLVRATPNSIPLPVHREQKIKNRDSSSLTDSFTNCKTLTQLKLLHCRNTKQGLNHHLTSMTELISSCISLGTTESLDYAAKSFDYFIKDEGVGDALYMYNSLIRGYSSCGLGDRAVLLYCQMVVNGVLPDKYTFPFVLSACAKVGAYSEGVMIHGAVVKMGFEGDVFVDNSLIHLYGECGKLDYGRKVFDKMSKRNVVSWTSLVCGCAKRDCAKEAVSLFFEMVAAGVKPNSVTMVCVISACAKLQNRELGEMVHGYIRDHEMEVNTHMVNALVDMYMKCDCVDIAKKLFDECADKNLVLCNTFMSNYVHQGMAREALSVLDEILRQGIRPDRVTMLSAISACAQLVDISSARQCHGYVLRNQLECWDSILNAMIDMYMKNGKQELACRIFDGMPNKTVVSWNSLVAGFTSNGDVESAMNTFNTMPEKDIVSWNTIMGALIQESMFEEVLELFKLMQAEGMKADRVTMMGVTTACAYLGDHDLAKWIHAYIEKNEIYCDVRLSTALVDMFARCGDPQTALKVFNNMKKRDVSAWTAAIGAMAMEGNGRRGVELFNEMIKQGVEPDGVVLVALLTACSHSGLVEQGRQFFRSMKERYGITPRVVHYGCMVDLLGRAGLLGQAVDLIKSMPMDPNDVIWSSLLAACRMQKDFDTAAYAAERLTKLAPERTGVQVLLSNIYASAEKWTDVAKVRLDLKEKGFRKVPGSSSIRVNGKVYEFTSGDESHPEMTSIELMLGEINSRLRDAGHVPDLTNVLLDVEEQEKEYLLSRHSEKLAMAYGLITTGRGMPIRVVKNLRICSDCHSFAKLVSKIYDREIIIRDNNRFHFFRQGVCSCCDYW